MAVTDAPAQDVRDRGVAPDLGGRVAVVTGATRGVGRGIAEALGACGATVYVTGRTVRGAPLPVYWGGRGETTTRTETLEETAELVTARGGEGVPVRVDHTADAQVAALFARVRAERGRLDVLVANAWGGYQEMERFRAPFWEQPLGRWDAMFGAGVRAVYTAAHQAVPLMLPQRRGLVVATTVDWPPERHDGRAVYALAKTATNRLIWGLAQDLRPHGVAAVALAPVGFGGWVTSGEELEALRAAAQTPGSTAALLRAQPRLATAQTPEYAGRAVAALAADPDVLAKTGRVLRVDHLAAEYGFTDVDGRRPPSD